MKKTLIRPAALLIAFLVINPPWTSRGSDGKDAQSARLAPSSAPIPASSGVIESEQDETAKQTDVLESAIEEWGTVSVSEPIILDNTNLFDLGPEASFPNANSYITSEKTDVSAAATQFSQSILAGQYALDANVGPAGAKTTSSGSSGGASAPGAPPSLTGTGFMDQTAFRAPASLLANGTPNGISERQSVILGVNDKITEMMLRKMVSQYQLADGRKVYVVLFQITCNPGWRTLQHYMADVNVAFEYAKVDSGTIKSLSLATEGTQPAVLAVLPLVDAQTMELGNSDRQLNALLLSLMAAGPTSFGSAGGNGLTQYIKSYQSDAASRNALPVINSYSTSTGMGFRFSPSFLALGDPAKKNSKSQNILIPTSFPVMAFIAVDPKDVKNKYTHFALFTHYRWMRKDHTFSLFPLEFPPKRETAMDRLDRDRSGDAMLNTLGATYKNSTTDDSIMRTLAFQGQRSDSFEMASKALVQLSLVKLPESLTTLKPMAVITKVQPQVLDPTSENHIVISGTNFTKDTVVYFFGQPDKDISVSGSNLIVATFDGIKNFPAQVTSVPVIVTTSNGLAADPTNAGVIAIAISQPAMGHTVKLTTITDSGISKVNDQGEAIPTGTSTNTSTTTTLQLPEAGSFKGDQLIQSAATIMSAAPKPASSVSPSKTQ